jgi:hypothetical protein
VKVATVYLVDGSAVASPANPAPFTAFVKDITSLSGNTNEAPINPNGSVLFENLGISFDLLVGITNLPANCNEGETIARSVILSDNGVTREVSFAVTCTLPNTGALEIRTEGLPAGSAPQIKVSGPSLSNVSLTTSGTTTFQDLTPGDYQITAQPAQVGALTYIPIQEVQTVSVIRAETAVVTVGHTVAPGALAVQITGLPDDLQADVTVAGPLGYSEALTESAFFDGVMPGSYTVRANPVPSADGLTTWIPDTPIQTVEVASGDTTTARLEYAKDQEPGQLDVVLAGIPAAVDADVTVIHPDGSSTHLTGSLLLTDLTPGVYTVFAASVEVAGATLEPEVDTQEVVVASGETAPAEVIYLTLTGNLLVDPGFEEGLHSVGTPVIPDSPGFWHSDLAFLKGAENGITPPEGSAMLRCDATGPFGAGGGSIGCEVFQILDVSSYAGVIDSGTASVAAEALFNRVAGDADTDRRFTVDVYAFTGGPNTVRAAISAQGWVARGFQNLTTDANLATWESERVVVPIPAGTRTLTLRVVAVEDVKDDAVMPEFDGHYMDDARLVLRYRQ